MRTIMKGKLKKSICLIFTAMLALTSMFFTGCTACTSFAEGNDDKYAPENCEIQETVLTGKTFYWLGSSVTLGMASMEDALPEYIAARNGATCIKDAVSGTTLAGTDKNGYIERLITSEYFDKDADIDAFFCQVSTNDAKIKAIDKLGSVTGADKTEYEDLDRSTAAGSMEYAVKYVEETWNCPIYFYTNAYIADEGPRSIGDTKGSDYKKMIDVVEDIADKWNGIEGYDVRIIDLFDNEEFNDISDEEYELYMYDAVHPYRAGYLEWWTPEVESRLIADMSEE